jgi:hypothetical protein
MDSEWLTLRNGRGCEIDHASRTAREIVRGEFDFVARLDIGDYCRSGRASVRAPYFSQVGLSPRNLINEAG